MNADVESTGSVSRQGLRRSNTITTKTRFTDAAARLQHTIKREKEQASNDFLSYEKIRWPHYKEVIYRRKNQTVLPSHPNQIKRMQGLVRAPPNANNSNIKDRQGTSGRSRTIEKSMHQSRTDLKASIDCGQPSGAATHIVNAQGHQIPLNTTRNTVSFDGDFESSNVDQVRQKAGSTFDVWMRNDSNGVGSLQWFYFRMKNTSDFTETVRINVVNFTKSNSLFHSGMKPSVWSMKQNRSLPEGESGWVQECCENVTYEPSTYQKEINDLNPQRQRSYWTMSFDYTFMYASDEVFVAYTVPYTYTQMQSHIRQLKLLSEDSHYKLIRFDSLGSSNGNIDIPLLKITNRSKSSSEPKPIIFIIGRQHCGETHSSFIIHGFINFLVSREVICHKMRELFEFWVAPIVNPDGVIIGNYRCNTQGKDMNRHFFADDDPEGMKLRLTEVELIRSYLKQMMPQGENMFRMFLDIHAHSAQNSIFCYAPVDEEANNNIIIKRFPMILDNLSPYFQYDNCKFGNEKYKKNCARLGVFRDWQIPNSFTIESSCYAYEVKGTDEVEQFKEEHFLKFGEHLLFGIAKHMGVELSDIDKAAMTHGYELELDYGLYTKDTREPKKGKKRKRDNRDGDRRRRRLNSNMGPRESRESIFRGSNTSWTSNKHTRHGDRDKDISSRLSRRANHTPNKAHISQTKFEMNPPGFSDETFSTMNNGVVLIMNQSQRDYFKHGINQRGIKLVSMSGINDNQTKAKVLSMLQNEQSRAGSRQGRVDSRQSQNRRRTTSRQFTKYNQSQDSQLQHQSTGETYDNKSSMLPYGLHTAVVTQGVKSTCETDGIPYMSHKQTEFEQALFAQFKMQDQAKREANIYTPPKDPGETPKARGGPPALVKKGTKRNRKVVITIKQQAPDGTMINIPQGALNQLAAAQGQIPTGVPQQQTENGQTVFRAQVHVDREKQKQITKRNQSQVDDNLFELIKELHNQHSNQKPNSMVQGMALDPNMIDQFQARQGAANQANIKNKSFGARNARFAEAAQEVLDGTVRKDLLGDQNYPNTSRNQQIPAGIDVYQQDLNNVTPNRANRRLVLAAGEQPDVNKMMQQAIAVQSRQGTANKYAAANGQQSRLQGTNEGNNADTTSDGNYRKIISGKDIGGQNFMMPNVIRHQGQSRSIAKQAAQSMLNGITMTPVHQINKKMSGIINGSPLHPGDSAFSGHSLASTPHVLPAEVLQAAAMSGGGGGRRNIKIRAMQSTPQELNNPNFMQGMQQQGRSMLRESNHTISPLSLKDQAQMQFISQRRISNQLQAQVESMGPAAQVLNDHSQLNSRQRNFNESTAFHQSDRKAPKSQRP